MNPRLSVFRYLLMLGLLLLFLVAVQNFDPKTESYAGLQIQPISGRPYLVLEEVGGTNLEERDGGVFSVYTPANDDLDGWTNVLETRSGQVLGVYETPAPETGKNPNLGFFFRNKAVTFETRENGLNPAGISKPLAFDWPPESASELKGQSYAFGALSPREPDDPTQISGTLKAAHLEKGVWIERKEAGPQFTFAAPGFWLKSVTLGERIAVLWREMRSDPTVGTVIEGYRISTEGDFGMAFYDGDKFSSATVRIKGLPRGNASVWADHGVIMILIQTSMANEDPGKGHMEIWSVAPDGSAKLAETIVPERHRIGLFPFIQAERFTFKDKDYILRSTWQNFELWRRAEGGAWVVAENGAKGLPAFSLERKLWWTLGVSAGLVLAGGLLALSRRRQALLVVEKLKPRDAYAPLSVRAGAYFLDFTLITAATLLIARYVYPLSFDDIFPSLVVVPKLPVVGCYLLYQVLTEWLCSATLGKYVMGLRVVMDGRERPSFWAALVRNAVGFYERQPLMLVVAIPMIFFSPRRQRLGDLLSRTVVVRKQEADALRARADAVRAETASSELGTETQKK